MIRHRFTPRDGDRCDCWRTENDPIHQGLPPRRHWSTLPTVRGFTRIPDLQTDTGPTRMLRCDACGETIRSLGVGYHQQGRPCTERADERRQRQEATRARQEARPAPPAPVRLETTAGHVEPGDTIVGVYDHREGLDPLRVAERTDNSDGTVTLLVEHRWPHRYLDAECPVTVERAAR